MKRIAVTLGDPSGVGPELVAAVLQKHAHWREKVVVIGPASVLERHDFGSETELQATASDGEVVLGVPSELTGRMALEAMRDAAEKTQRGVCSGVVTGPISKEWCQRAGMRHAGQTEYFAEQWGGSPTMAFYADAMVVSLVTWHIPLMEVVSCLTETALRRTVRHTWEFLERLGRTQKGIGVCGLNPHAGEAGRMGCEELEFLNPLLEKLAADGVPVSQCLPSDTLFYRHMNGEFDALVALYHDQGLAPLKTVAFHNAVNVTLGLSHLRMSPDHGTAFDIAGKGVARSDSFEAAIRLMLKLITE